MRHTLTMQNIFLRQRAREYTRKHYWRLLAMAGMVYALTSGLQWLMNRLGDQVMSAEIATLTVAINQYVSTPTISSTAALRDAMIALFSAPKFWLYNVVYVLVLWLFTAGVGLGQTGQYLRAGMGEQPRVLGAFTRMKHCFKALRLSFWAGLKTVLWAIPGAAVMLAGLFITACGTVSIEQAATYAGIIVMLCGYALLIALVFMAAMRYCLATYILAESPEKGVIACVKESKTLMAGHKWQLFKLGIPVLLMMLGALLAVSMVGGMLLTPLGLESNVLALNVVNDCSSLAALLFLPRLNMLYALFYLLQSDIARNATTAPVPPAPATEDAPAEPAAPAETPAE